MKDFLVRGCLLLSDFLFMLFQRRAWLHLSRSVDAAKVERASSTTTRRKAGQESAAATLEPCQPARQQQERQQAKSDLLIGDWEDCYSFFKKLTVLADARARQLLLGGG